jgi:hypothetical protein
MVVMKLLLLAALACVVALGASSPQLQQVQSVYILPMGSGMDQFLANRLARFGKMQVVADPQHADAILTDRLGEPFEKKLDELYPAAPVEKDTDDEDATATVKEEPARIGSFSRGRGTFFLVDRKTRNVLWSTYERPKNGSPDELNRTAERVVNNLKHDLKPAQTGQ